MDSNNIDTTKKVKIFFFPFIAAGHLLPMIGTARSFATHHDVEVTIIATPKNVQLFQDAINHDRDAGHDIKFHTIELPDNDNLNGVENFLEPVPLKLKIKVLKAISNLKDPLKDILIKYKPDCLVSDPMHPWSLDVTEEVGIPRILFHSSSLFTLCCEEILWRFKPHEKLSSDTEPLVLEGLPDRVEFTKKMIPHWHWQKHSFTEFFHDIRKSNENSYGIIINSVRGLEKEYYEYYSRNVVDNKVWFVGPVNNVHHSSTTTTTNTLKRDENIINWLDSKEACSVLYVSFGSEAPLSKEQFHEIAYGLKASGHPFIWAARTESDEKEWFPDGFEMESNQGLVIRGWAPQVMILSHGNVGGFMTHCGWNACLEGLINGLPMITWPITVDQFFNESLLVDVLKVATRVGNKDEASLDIEAKATVVRDQVKESVRRVLGGGDGGGCEQGIRDRVKRFADMSKEAVLEGGSSFQDIQSLIQELKARSLKE